LSYTETLYSYLCDVDHVSPIGLAEYVEVHPTRKIAKLRYGTTPFPIPYGSLWPNALVLLDVNETSLTETAKRLEKSGTHVITVTGSEAEPETARPTCAEAVRQYGHIDVLINNAGVFSIYPSLELPLEEWKRVLDVNLTGVFLCAQEAAREMIRAKAGVILNIASAYGVVAAPKRAAYCVARV
jgi:NAD(P)-dependent dehydrogenase (short-subunit alcohol dehydrogenase family)